MKGSLKMIYVVFAFCLAAAIASPAQATFTTLLSFTAAEQNPAAALIQATDGNFYGTTANGGHYGHGTVFKITPGGTLTRVYSFGNNGGAYPTGALVQSANGNFYGTTLRSGGDGAFPGTVFRMTPGGVLTVLHYFCGQPNCSDGFYPYAGLMLGSDGDFYGATQGGGAITPNCYYWCGTVFKITAGGTLTTLHSFDGTDGADPDAGLIPVPDGGNYYGTTSGHSAAIPYSTCPSSCGTVFRITPAGALIVVHSFDGTDGSNPTAELVHGSDGNFYGTTSTGGASSNCTGGCGTVFKITPGGILTTLHSFDGSAGDGSSPQAGLVQGTDGNFYGTTSGGNGTIFRITPTGNITTLYNFDAGEGSSPMGALLQGTDGNFYGTTYWGGAYNYGTIFKLSVGLGPFVTSQTYSGKEGANVIILGNNLTGATGVSFSGTAATTFTVVSASEITATVPAGATTGKIQVTTPGGTLTSNKPFYVTPQVLSFTPASGPVGTSVQITGTGLTQTKVVTFGGVEATSFTANSDTQITATVPTGAVTGRVVVSTPGGTAWSASNFTVQ